LAQAAARHGAYLTFGSDAHVATRVGCFDECLKIVKETGIPASAILGTDPQAFLQFLVAKQQKDHLKEFFLRPPS
jgi:putative hydrolase